MLLVQRGIRDARSWLPMAVLLAVVLVVGLMLTQSELPRLARTAIAVGAGVLAAGATHAVLGRRTRD